MTAAPSPSTKRDGQRLSSRAMRALVASPWASSSPRPASSRPYLLPGERVWQHAGLLQDGNFNREGLPLVLFANWNSFSGGQRDIGAQVWLVHCRRACCTQAATSRHLASCKAAPWTLPSTATRWKCTPTTKLGATSSRFTTAICLRPRSTTRSSASASGPPPSAPVQTPQSSKRPSRTAKPSSCRSITRLRSTLAGKPGRMIVVGVIRDVVPWRRSRRFIYRRLARRLPGAACIHVCDDVVAKSGVDVHDDAEVADWFASESAKARIAAVLSARRADSMACDSWCRSSLERTTTGSSEVPRHVHCCRREMVTSK